MLIICAAKNGKHLNFKIIKITILGVGLHKYDMVCQIWVECLRSAN